MTEWRLAPLGDVLELQRGFDITKAQQRPGSVPVVSSSGIGSWHDTAKCSGPGVVVGRKGSLGTVFFIEGDYWPHDTTLWVRDFKGNDPSYCSLLLKFLRLGELDTGASNPTLNRNHAHLLPTMTPDTEAQRRIARVIFVFDDLIHNNRRRIEILEETARSLYREWFIHLRFPGRDSVDLVDRPQGMIPQGWIWRPLRSLGRWLSGGTPSTQVEEYWGGEIPWVTSGSLTSFVLADSERRLTAEGVAAGSRLVGRDTLVFVVRGMSLAKEFRRGIADVPMAFGQDCKALVAAPGIEPLLLAFAVDALGTKIQGMVEYAAHGTGKLSTDRLQALETPVPSPAVQAQFVERIRPLRELISVLGRESVGLHNAREMLLPKLVTGMIEVDSLGVEDVFGWAELAEASAVDGVSTRNLR